MPRDHTSSQSDSSRFGPSEPARLLAGAHGSTTPGEETTTLVDDTTDGEHDDTTSDGSADLSTTRSGNDLDGSATTPKPPSDVPLSNTITPRGPGTFSVTERENELTSPYRTPRNAAPTPDSDHYSDAGAFLAEATNCTSEDESGNKITDFIDWAQREAMAREELLRGHYGTPPRA